MRVSLYLDDRFLEHVAPRGHPERPDRLRAIASALESTGLASRCARPAIRAASRDELERVHTRPYLERLEGTLPGRSGYLDPDTYYSPGSWEAAIFAAGTATEAARAALAGECDHAAVFVRPPGHHAEAAGAMGFCLLDNIAVAAATARAQGAPRVAIVDWDVHHGNGTQDIFYSDASVLYLSLHQYPFYPGSGAHQEIGVGAGRGATLNVPLPAGMGNADYRYLFDALVAPALRAFDPALVLVSAGYDAHKSDPLGGMALDARGFAAMTAALRGLERPIVTVLEGGYDLAGLAESAAATVDLLLGGAAPNEGAPVPGPDARASCAAARAALAGTPLGEKLANL